MLIIKRLVKQKIFSVFLFLTMIFFVFFGIQKTSAFLGGGTGTSADPFLITTCQELQSIEDDALAGTTEGRFYKLANDIDCSDTVNWNEGAGFNPIGLQFTEFRGIFDGAGFAINDLYINRPLEDSVGLFASTSSLAIVANLTLNNPDITGQNIVGALTGNARAISTGVSVVGGSINGVGSVGGLFGRLQNTSNASFRLYFQGTVTGSGNWVGGIIGDGANGMINNSYVDAVVSGNNYVGGLVGRFSACCGRAIDSYSIGTVSGNQYVGGIVGGIYDAGQTFVENVFSAMEVNGTLNEGAVIGIIFGHYAPITASNLHFDQTLAGISDCISSSSVAFTCTAQNTDGLSPDYFHYNTNEPLASWDFENIWVAREEDYPVLGPNEPLSGPGVVQNINVVEGESVADLIVGWDSPSTFGTFPLNGYHVQIKKSANSWDIIENSITTSNLSASISELDPSTEYDIRVRANTLYGSGEWVGVTFTTGDRDSYTINSCAELQNMSEIGSPLDIYTLTSDIDCGDIDNFEPISWDGGSFKGVLDGQGFTISNINIEGDDNYGFGLFVGANNATIQDLTMRDGSINVINDSGYCGAVAGSATSVDLSGILIEDYTITCDAVVGGVFGFFEVDSGDSVSVLDVGVVGGQISATGYVAGGLMGLVEVGSRGVLTFDRVFTNTNISTPDTAGGIFADLFIENEEENLPSSLLIIRNSYSKTNVSVSSDDHAGGIAGNLSLDSDSEDTPSKILIENVYTSGDISANSEVGGFFGDISSLDSGEEIEIINSFTLASLESGNPIETHAIVGEDDFISGEVFILDGVYFDQTRTGQSQAIYEEDYEGVFAVNNDDSQPNYFIGNSTSAPMSAWDFDDIWLVVANDTPVLRYFNDSPSVSQSDTAPRRSSGGYASLSLLAQMNQSVTVEQLLAQVAQLQALLAQLQSTSPTSPQGPRPTCSPLLRQGSRGENVRLLQQRLGVTPQSGIFGPLTLQAVRDFQQSKGIRVDGIAGPQTCLML